MIRNNILATLAYYDILDLPLRAEEILRYLIKTGDNDVREISIQEVKKTLDQLVLEGVVDIDQKYYFLKDRDYLVPLRFKKEKISAKKWAKAKQAIWWLKFVPYVKTVFASGTLALNNCDELSDLDVLVVAKHGRIWLTRILVSGVMSVLGVRRKWSDRIAPNKICLNHYITDESLRIPFESIYNAQTYINLKPILLKDKNIVARLHEENNWLGKYLEISPLKYQNYDIMIYHSAIKFGRLAATVTVAGERFLNSWVGNWLERLAKKYQIKRIEKNPLTRRLFAGEKAPGERQSSSHIIYSNEMLAFHPDSPEEDIVNKYETLLAKLK